jgi:hypothetical protein
MGEALGVVSVIASIVQVVHFSKRVLTRLEDYGSRAGELPKAFGHIKAELPVLQNALSKTKEAHDAGRMRDEDAKVLLPTVEECERQVRALDDLIAKALPSIGDSWIRKGRKALASLMVDSEVERIVAVIQRYTQIFTYHNTTSIAFDPPLGTGQPRILLNAFRQHVIFVHSQQ